LICQENLIVWATPQISPRKKNTLNLTLETGLPDFSCCNIPKWGKYTKQSGNIPNVRKIWQMAVKIPDGHKIYQHLPLKDPLKLIQICIDFWSENKPSGNPA
jgi:hypothetical protein